MSDPSGANPEPPPDLATRTPLIFFLPQGSIVYRICRSGRSPLHFGRGTSRFDAPGSEFGVLYTGEDEYVCFIETCVPSVEAPAVTGAFLGSMTLAALTVTRNLRLVDLAASGGLARIGADARLMSGPRDVSRRWSAALRELPARPDGICYRSRRDGERRAFAIYECSPPPFLVEERGALMAVAIQPLLGRILEHYGKSLID